MADNFTTSIQTIWDHNTFCEMSKKFDEKYNTQTYVGRDTIENIRQRFPMLKSKPIPEQTGFVDSRVRQNINLAFTVHKRTECRSEDYIGNHKKTPHYELHFFNSLYRFLIDIRAGKGLYGPMSISRFVNHNSQIHPGSHRLFMGAVYKDPITFILTDYMNKPNLHKKKKLKLSLPEDTHFDWRRGRWGMREMNHHNTYWCSTHREKKYRDIVDQTLDGDEHSFHQPEMADRHYVLDGDVVLVNNMPVCELVDDKWRVCCV